MGEDGQWRKNYTKSKHVGPICNFLSKAAENGMGQLSRMYSITGSRSHWDTAKNVFSVTGVVGYVGLSMYTRRLVGLVYTEATCTVLYV
jgi:hypothetical protein